MVPNNKVLAFIEGKNPTEEFSMYQVNVIKMVQRQKRERKYRIPYESNLNSYWHNPESDKYV